MKRNYKYNAKQSKKQFKTKTDSQAFCTAKEKT